MCYKPGTESAATGPESCRVRSSVPGSAASPPCKRAARGTRVARSAPQLIEQGRRPDALLGSVEPRRLTAEDLRDALLADLQHSGDRLLWQAATGGGADLEVAFGAQLFSFLVEFRLALCEVPGERR
jgi:hypothetical protein